MRKRVSREELFAELFQGADIRDVNGEYRITRVRVPGREIDLAHTIGISDTSIYENLGLDIGVHDGEDHTGQALGFMRFTPWEAVVVAADIALKAATVELGFMDRFNGSLILCGEIAEIQSAQQAVLDYFRDTLHFHVCRMTRR